MDWGLTCVGDISMNASPILAAVLTGLSSLSRPYSLYHLLRAWKHWIQISQKIRNEILNFPPPLPPLKCQMKNGESKHTRRWNEGASGANLGWPALTGGSRAAVKTSSIESFLSFHPINGLTFWLLCTIWEKSCASLVFNVKQAAPQSQHPQGIFSNTTFCQEYPDE